MHGRWEGEDFIDLISYTMHSIKDLLTLCHGLIIVVDLEDYKLAFNYLKVRRFVDAVDISHKVLGKHPQ